MQPQQKIAFQTRAAHLFGWKESSTRHSSAETHISIPEPIAVPERHIIVGIVSDQASSTIEGTLLDLAAASEVTIANLSVTPVGK